MAIRCSIVGCEYDDTHIEREKERRGEEVILTVREFKECARCGNTELISENTGVTSAPRPDDGVDDEETAEEGTGDPEETTDPEPTEEPAAEPESTTDDPGDTEPTTDDAGETTDPGPAEPTTPGGSGPETGTDDAVILDGDAGSSGPTPDPERGRPAAPEPEPATPGTTGDAETAKASSEPEPTDAATAGAESGARTTAESEEEVTDDAVFIDGTGDRTGGLDEAASMDDEPTIASGTTDAEEEYPEDDAVILDSSGGDPREGTGVGLDDEDLSGATGGWPEHDDHRGTRTRTADAGTPRSAGERGSGGERGSTSGGAERTSDGWPDVDDADEGWDASPDTEEPGEVEFSGVTPEASGGGAVAKERPLSGESEAVESGTEPESRPRRSETSSSPAGDLYCTGCGNAVDRDSSPHRAGDVCPDCSREYLAER